jgi:PhnB protein
MSIRSINAYLMFNGTADEAIRLYESALGARTEGAMRWGDAPGMHIPDAQKGRVMHASLHIDRGVIMVADDLGDSPAAAQTNVHVCLHFDDVDEAKKKFEALAAGGKVTMPLQDTFWGATFGTLTDAFGIRWMFNCDKKPA